MLQRLLKPLAALSIAFVLSASGALAVSDDVRQFCREDYFAHCPNHALGSANLRRCMKTAGPKLSSGCIKALVASGEISQAEVRQIGKRLKNPN